MDTRLRTSIIGAGVGSVASLLAWGAVMLVRRRSSSKSHIEPDMLTAIMVAVLSHRAYKQAQILPTLRQHAPEQPVAQWVLEGRMHQHQRWHPHQR